MWAECDNKFNLILLWPKSLIVNNEFSVLLLLFVFDIILTQKISSPPFIGCSWLKVLESKICTVCTAITATCKWVFKYYASMYWSHIWGKLGTKYHLCQMGGSKLLWDHFVIIYSCNTWTEICFELHYIRFELSFLKSNFSALPSYITYFLMCWDLL